jgi:spermine oxidase
MVAKKPRVVIVGAGVAGLAAAQRLYGAAGDRFDVTVVEAGSRAGGRVLTSEFAGHRVEMGATWVQGILGSPVYALVVEDGDGGGLIPYERMDGFPDRVLTVAEGGAVVDADRVAGPVEELYRGMMAAARAGKSSDGGGVEEYLRRGLRAYQAARPGLGDKELEDVEEALLAMQINRERTDTSADDLGDLDLAAEREYQDFPGDHVTVPDGYSRVVDRLVAALPPSTVRLGLRLRRLDWGRAPARLHFADGAPTLATDHVIVTVSLGVLKASLLGKQDAAASGAIAFDPPLPPSKREAVALLGFGVVNKLFMEVEPVAEAPASSRCVSRSCTWRSAGATWRRSRRSRGGCAAPSRSALCTTAPAWRWRGSPGGRPSTWSAYPTTRSSSRSTPRWTPSSPRRRYGGG